MIERLQHDDDVMAQVRALTDKVNELIDPVEQLLADREMLVKERVGEVIFQMARAEAEQGLLKMPLVFVHGRAHGQEIVEYLVENNLAEFADGDSLVLTEVGRDQGRMMMGLAESEADKIVAEHFGS